MSAHDEARDQRSDRTPGGDGPAVDRLAEFVEGLTGVDVEDNVEALRAWWEDGTVRTPLDAVAHTLIDLRETPHRSMRPPRYLDAERDFAPLIDLTTAEPAVDRRFRRKDRPVASPRGASDRPTGRTSEGFVPA